MDNASARSDLSEMAMPARNQGVRNWHPGQLTTRAAVFVTSVAAALFAPGCDEHPAQEVAKAIPHPTFSTLVENERRSLTEAQSEAAALVALEGALAKPQQSVQNFIKQADAKAHAADRSSLTTWVAAGDGEVTELKSALQNIDSVLSDAKHKHTVWSPAGDAKLQELQESASRLQTTLASGNVGQSWTIAQGSELPSGLVVATALDSQLTDVRLTLNWDARQLDPALHAPKLIEAIGEFQGLEQAIAWLEAGADKEGVAWFSHNSSQVATIRTDVTDGITYVTKMQNEQVFAPIAMELKLLQSTLSDLSTSIASDDAIRQHWTMAEGASAKTSGVLLADQAQKFLAAIREDFKQELSTVGIQQPVQSGAMAGNTVTNSSTQPVIIHHNSGMNNWMMWYLLTRGDRDYRNSQYVPQPHYSYSGTGRLYGSPGWSNFAAARDASFATNGGKSDLQNAAAKAAKAQAEANAAAHAAAQRSQDSHSSGFGGGGSFHPSIGS